MTRLLFIAPLPEPVTGQAVACQTLLDDLVGDHRVETVDLKKREYKQGVSSFSRIGEVLRIALRAWRGQRGADLIYLTPAESFAGSLRDALIYLVCFRRLGRMVIHLHGGAGMREILLKPHPLRRVNEFFLRRLGGAIVLGERHADIYANVLPRKRIHIVANFAESELFADVASVERKFDQTVPLRLLFLSNLIPGKGHVELLDAFLSLDPDTRAALRLDIAGGFEADDQKRRFLTRIEGVPEIRYHGTVRGAPRRALWQQSHVFCLPTYYPYEGQPLSILEAFASGCAVITTDHSGIFDTFTPDVNGYVVEKRSAADLAAALRRAVANPDRLRTMALTNFSTADRRYRPADFTAGVRRVLAQVGAHAADGTRPAGSASGQRPRAR